MRPVHKGQLWAVVAAACVPGGVVLALMVLAVLISWAVSPVCRPKLRRRKPKMQLKPKGHRPSCYGPGESKPDCGNDHYWEQPDNGRRMTEEGMQLFVKQWNKAHDATCLRHRVESKADPTLISNFDRDQKLFEVGLRNDFGGLVDYWKADHPDDYWKRFL